jgi:hypothetical protein
LKFVDHEGDNALVIDDPRGGRRKEDPAAGKILTSVARRKSAFLMSCWNSGLVAVTRSSPLESKGNV